MTRLPWQFNWQSRRPALMVPNTTDPDISCGSPAITMCAIWCWIAVQRPSDQAHR